MKNCSILFVLTLFFFAVQTANATIYRVNNTGVTGVNVFDNYNDAEAAASAGDTIHIEGSALSYGNFNVGKTLVIIGTGYLLGENPGLQASALTSLCGNIIILPGAPGTVLTGLNISQLDLRAPDCVILRNRFRNTLFLGDVNGVDVSNSVIKQNLFDQTASNNPSISFSQNPTDRGNILIANNIILRNVTLNGSGASGIFVNNTIYGESTGVNYNLPGFQLINNLLLQGTLVINGTNTFFNNISTTNAPTQFPAGNGNQQNLAIADLITQEGGSFLNDKFHQLSVTSPALGAGQNGEDVGAFGGNDPYRLSGIPSVPTIYELIAPTTGTNSINVTISTRSNN